MNNPTASKQYVLPLQFVSGDITSSFFDDVQGVNTLRIYYYKVGNLYFGFSATQLANGQATPTIGGSTLSEYNDTVSRVCSQLGITLDTAYQNFTTVMYGTNSDCHWDGVSSWASNAGGANTYALKAILAN